MVKIETVLLSHSLEIRKKVSGHGSEYTWSIDLYHEGTYLKCLAASHRAYGTAEKAYGSMHLYPEEPVYMFTYWTTQEGTNRVFRTWEEVVDEPGNKYLVRVYPSDLSEVDGGLRTKYLEIVLDLSKED